MPDRLRVPFYLWTRAAVRTLIREQFGVSLSLAAVSGYMKRLGCSSQRPVTRALRRTAQPMKNVGQVQALTVGRCASGAIDETEVSTSTSGLESV